MSLVKKVNQNFEKGAISPIVEKTQHFRPIVDVLNELGINSYTKRKTAPHSTFAVESSFHIRRRVE
jgi:hypothetical protein